MEHELTALVEHDGEDGAHQQRGHPGVGGFGRSAERDVATVPDLERRHALPGQTQALGARLDGRPAALGGWSAGERGGTHDHVGRAGDRGQRGQRDRRLEAQTVREVTAHHPVRRQSEPLATMLPSTGAPMTLLVSASRVSYVFSVGEV